MRKYLTEFIGTFFLVLTIGLVVAKKADLGFISVAIAIGSSLMVMIFMGGHVSGGHYNPAVSLAALIRGKLDVKDLLPYWIAQLAAAAAAAGAARQLLGQPPLTEPTSLPSFGVMVFAEFLYTFALALVVLNSATAKGTAGNSFYGLAIGFTVVTGVLSVGLISGGALNPAVGVGVVLMGGGTSRLLVHLLGPLAGGALAGVVFKVQNPGE